MRDDPTKVRGICSWCGGDHYLAECDKMREEVEKEYVPPVPATLFICNLDKSKCEHEWNNEGCNPTHCVKCGQSFTAYAFMEAP